MKKLQILLSSILILLISPSFSQGAQIKIDVLEKNNESGNIDTIAKSNCTYLNSGPAKPYDKKIPFSDYKKENYRVGFVLHEIYYNIVVEKIQSPEEDGDIPKITSSINIDGIKLAEAIKLKEKGEVITDIEFVKWNSWNSFTLKIHKKLVKFKILENPEIELSF